MRRGRRTFAACLVLAGAGLALAAASCLMLSGSQREGGSAATAIFRSTSPQDQEPPRIFKDVEEKRLYGIRRKAASDLESFLGGGDIGRENLAALNAKIAVLGLEADSEGRVRLMGDSEYAAVLGTLPKSELARYEALRRGPAATGGDSSSPEIAIADEEEEEEEAVPVPGSRKDRVERRRRQITSYLYTVFQYSLSRTSQSGGRKTIAGDVLEDTMSHYRQRQDDGAEP